MMIVEVTIRVFVEINDCETHEAAAELVKKLDDSELWALSHDIKYSYSVTDE